MLSNVRSVGAFRKCAFLFLALSVFWFGLHARLGANKPAASNISDSKISTEKHSAEVLKALDKQDSLADHLNALVLGFFLRGVHSAVAPLPLGELARIELADPRRLDIVGADQIDCACLESLSLRTSCFARKSGTPNHTGPNTFQIEGLQESLTRT
jgi:hypothetical protein